MATASYIPPKDADFLAWALNFSTLITATPTAFGLIAGQATTYATLYATFNTALAAASNPATRTKVTVAAKNVARAALERNTRLLAGVVQGFPTITPSQLASLGLTVRSPARPPIPVPTTAPILSIVQNGPLTSAVRFADTATPASRAKPFGATGLQLYVKYGTVAPVSVADCTLLGIFTKNPVVVNWPAAQAGMQAWIIARWITRKGLTGPVSTNVSTTIIA